jgi:hypothetical protein
MNPSERLKCLADDIEKLVNRYGRDSNRYKKTALILRVTSVFLAGTITVLLGLKLQSAELKDLFSNVALVLGSVITVLAAYEAFFDPRSLWVRETVTFARLKDLQRDVRFWTAGVQPDAVDAEILEMFKRRLDRVLDDSLKYWMKIRGAPDIEGPASHDADRRSTGIAPRTASNSEKT